MVGKNWLAVNGRIVLFWCFKSVHGRFDLKEAKFLNASFNFCFFTLLKTFVCISKLIFKVSHTLKKKLKILFDLKLTFVRRTFSDDSKQVVKKARYIYDNIYSLTTAFKLAQTPAEMLLSTTFLFSTIYIQMISPEILSIKNCLSFSLCYQRPPRRLITPKLWSSLMKMSRYLLLTLAQKTGETRRILKTSAN